MSRTLKFILVALVFAATGCGDGNPTEPRSTNSSLMTAGLSGKVWGCDEFLLNCSGLGGATVKLDASTCSTITSATGFYFLNCYGGGKYCASATGYRTECQMILSSQTTADFYLALEGTSPELRGTPILATTQHVPTFGLTAAESSVLDRGRTEHGSLE